MKKIFLTLAFLVIVVISFTSCTQNQRAKRWGGKQTINLQSNERLVNMTWKDDNLWILTEDTIKHVFYFREQSSFGILEGQITVK